MIGERFGRWTVIDKAQGTKHNKRYLCRCDCGNETSVLGFTLRYNRSTQCINCYKDRGHRQSKTPTYRTWTGLFTRCYNKKNATYKYYGAKGITVSDHWKSFDNFFNDMGERPTGYQIDRIDPKKGYCKDNCRWVSKVDNTKRQNNRLIDVTGMKFGKWTVIDRDFTKTHRDQAYWNCVCDCGKKQSVVGSLMRRGETKQCLDCKHEAHRGWSDRLKMKDRNNER